MGEIAVFSVIGVLSHRAQPVQEQKPVERKALCHAHPEDTECLEFGKLIYRSPPSPYLSDAGCCVDVLQSVKELSYPKGVRSVCGRDRHPALLAVGQS